MTRTEDLYESARLTELHNRTKIVTVLAKDMMQLVELCRLQHRVVESLIGMHGTEEAIDAFERFEQGEK